MVDKILLSSKLLAEKIEFKFSEIDINKLILESINYNKKYADKKGVNIKFNSIKNFPLVKADKKYLKIVLDYIINNAIKFSDNKKENKYVEIKISQFENRCIISIEDNGIGIEKENLDKIFLKFEHNEDLMAHSKGMGLSLPICKEIIVYGHNNKIWCESEKNKGSVFYFSVDIQFVS
jgi:two-component system OmpR family sensor kinase